MLRIALIVLALVSPRAIAQQSFSSFGSGCACDMTGAGEPSMRIAGMRKPQPGNYYVVWLTTFYTQTQRPRIYWLSTGLQQIALPVNRFMIGNFGCWLWVWPAHSAEARIPQVRLSVPNDHALIGAQVLHQMTMLDADPTWGNVNFCASNGLRVTIQAP